MKKSFLLLLTTILLFSCTQKDLTIVNLKCEYLDSPLSIAVKQPHFSWQLNSELNSFLQQAYEIKVWNEEGEKWNSGRVESGISVNITYKGILLESEKTYNWQVCIWDNKGNTHTSEEAVFETGLMKVSDWKAKWIGIRKDKNDTLKYDLDDNFWIWYPEPNKNEDEPKGERLFKYQAKGIELDKIEAAFFITSADDACTLYINKKEIGTSGWLKNNEFEVLEFLKNGNNLLEFKVKNEWGGAGVIGQLYLKHKDGTNQYISTNKSWKTSKDGKKWVAAKAFAKSGEGEGLEWLNENSYFPAKILPASYLRKEFSAPKSVKKARLYATSLGIYEFHINGKKVSNNHLAPGFTDYKKRVLYQTYDVTDMLKKGGNAIGAIIGDGWYTGTIGWGHQRNHYGNYPLWLLAQINITYSDGSVETIITDNNWKGTTDGPITFSDFLDGEIYDANKELTGWSNIEYNDSLWMTTITKDITENIMADPGPQVVMIKDISPINISKLNEKEYIVDMGQNMVGWIELKVNGNKGDMIKIKHAEMLKDDGSLYMESLRSAKATDKYILKGGEETLHPHFTFHGFRYISIEGCNDQPLTESIIGKVLQSNTPVTGTFECSNKLVNQIYKNAVWGQRGNFISIPTDCPQRDERLGWMGDAQVFVKTAAYNMDVCAFFNKWMYDVVDAQAEDGGFSDVSPRIIDMSNGAPAWGDAGVIVPWTIYNMYGNKDMLERHYKSYVAWIEYVKENNPDLLWVKNRFGNFGDWLNTNAVTDKDVIGTAFFAYSTDIVSKIAADLGKKEDAEKYSKLFEDIKEAFNKAYVSKDGKVKNETQTAYVIALRFNLLPEEKREKAAKLLVEDIKEKDMHHSTGFVGIGHLLPVLSQYGYNEVAYTLISNNTFPSLGYMVENGATTIWERWDGYTKEKGFQSAGMNSFNHYSLGSPTEWLYTHVLGITAITPGFKEFNIAPKPGGGLTYAKGSFSSVYGEIISDWKLEGNILTLKVKIPENSTATVIFPGKLTEKNIEPDKVEENQTIISLGSGEYTFVGEFIEIK